MAVASVSIHALLDFSFSCFPGALITSTAHNILSKPLTVFPHHHHRTMESSKKGMNPIGMTIINAP